MLHLSRRALLASSSAALIAEVAGDAGAQPAPRYDLLIKGGEVVDPSQGLRGHRDVAIRNAQIAAVETDIPRERASQVIDATGKLVCPGLVDP